MGYLYRLKEISTNLLENQDFIELARKISILELYSLMILNRSFYMPLSPSRSVRCETKNHPLCGCASKVIPKKLQTRYNKGVQTNCKAKGEKYGTKGS